MANIKKKKMRTIIASRSSGKALSTELTKTLSSSMLVIALRGRNTRNALNEDSESPSSTSSVGPLLSAGLYAV